MSHTASGSSADDKVPILFVAGTGHSGSTLIANLLGAVPGLVSVGELRYLWERGLSDGGLCGCGQTLRRCPLWSTVLSNAKAADTTCIETAQIIEETLLRVRHLPTLLKARGAAEILGPAAARYVNQLQAVLRAVRDASPGDVIVDSSKLPSYGYLLKNIDGLNVKVLHVIRDPRAAAHSWSKARRLEPERHGPHHIRHEGAAKSVLLWDLWNAAAARLWSREPHRYIRLRYEDFVADPARALTPVLRMLGLPQARIPVIAGGFVDLPVSHTVAGNPNRMTHGSVRIVNDMEWIDRLPTRDRTIVACLASPLLRPFGYPLRMPER